MEEATQRLLQPSQIDLAPPTDLADFKAVVDSVAVALLAEVASEVVSEEIAEASEATVVGLGGEVVLVSKVEVALVAVEVIKMVIPLSALRVAQVVVAEDSGEGMAVASPMEMRTETAEMGMVVTEIVNGTDIEEEVEGSTVIREVAPAAIVNHSKAVEIADLEIETTIETEIVTGTVEAVDVKTNGHGKDSMTTVGMMIRDRSAGTSTQAMCSVVKPEKSREMHHGLLAVGIIILHLTIFVIAFRGFRFAFLSFYIHFEGKKEGNNRRHRRLHLSFYGHRHGPPTRP